MPRAVYSLCVLAGVSIACSEDPVGQQTAADVVTDHGAVVAMNAHDAHGRSQIAILDDCATDPAWAPTGGCTLRDGAVTEAGFGAFLSSPLSLSVVGHPAWRNEPSYLRIDAGQHVRVTNEGGRTHTFTRVAEFGGGFVPPLSQGLTQTPECVPGAPTTNELAPGDRLELNGLAPGDHRYQCCIHPWMRALVKVQ